MGKSCKAFMAAWKSEYENCFTCIKWNRDDLVCMDPEEVARRKKAQERATMDKLMRQSKAVYIQPD